MIAGLQNTQAPVQKQTMRSRIRKRYNLTQCAKFMNVGTQYLSSLAQDANFPLGITSGRERTFTIDDLFLMRAMLAQKAKRPRDYLCWRTPEDPLRVISFASQKGGTGKSISAAHFAQYLSLHFGMRVGLIDADPQATLTLYFSGADEHHLFHHNTPTLVDFLGLYFDENNEFIEHDAKHLNSHWQKSAWPGTRIIPSHASVSEGEIQIARLLQTRSHRRFYRLLYEAIERWKHEYTPQTSPESLHTKNGGIDQQRFQNALTECLDVIIIDYQPALTLFQLNNLIASTDLVVPQTMKGFDLATLNTFMSNLHDLVDEIRHQDSIDVCYGSNVILPTIIQRANTQDIDQLAGLMAECGNAILPVHVFRSDAISNASTVYQSCYEYVAPPNQRQSMRRFTTNINAANDAITCRIWPHLERDYASQWIAEQYSSDEE